jgi:hypothetical protein
MKRLYTYLVEKQGYLDYDAFINDIMDSIYASEEFIGRIYKEFIENIDPRSEKYAKLDFPEFDINFFDLNIKIKSDNYPYWLKELYIKSYEDIDFAAVDTDLIVIDNDKKTLKSATIYINIHEFSFSQVINDYINKTLKTKIFDLRKKYIDLIVDKKGYNFSLEDWATDEYYDEQEKLITNFKKTLKIDKNIPDIPDWRINNLKDILSHEIKHLFDYYIAHYKQSINLIKDWDSSSYIKISSQNKNIESLFSDLLYIFDKRELSAFKQQLISQIKHEKNDKNIINNLNAELNLVINNDISTFHNYVPNNIDDNVFNSSLYSISSMQNGEYLKNDLETNTQTYEEICYIIKEFKLSEKILGKKFKGKTKEDFNKFLEQCFNKIKKIYIDVLKKAVKHLV